MRMIINSILIIILFVFASLSFATNSLNHSSTSLDSKSCQVLARYFLDDPSVYLKSGKRPKRLVESIGLIRSIKEADEIEVSDQEVRDIALTIKRVNEEVIGQSELIQPVHIDLVINDQGSNASFRPTDYRISTITQFVRNVKINSRTRTLRAFTKHPIFTRAVTAHEYGHAIFRANYHKRNPEFAKVSIEYAEIRKESDWVYKEIDELGEKSKRLYDGQREIAKKKGIEWAVYTESEDFNKFLNSKELLELEDYEDFLFDYLNMVNDEQIAIMEKLFKQRDTVTSYNELFADVISVLEDGNNPKSVSEGLNNTGWHESLEGKTNTALYRDFSNRKNHWSKWKEEEEEHIMMAPARYHIYQLALKKPRYDTQKGKGIIVKNVFEAICTELEFRFSNPGIELSPTEWNKRLIKEIDKQFANNYL